MRHLRSLAVLAAWAFVGIASAATAGEGLKGTFTLKGPDDATWALKFDGKDKFTVTRDGQEGVEGTYKITKDQIEFTDEKGPFASKADEKTGTYKWKLTDRKLTLTVVKDPGKGRATVLTSGTWELKD